LQKISIYNQEVIIVRPEERITTNVMSKFEMTENVSIRAHMIAEHNDCMVDITGLDNSTDMAKRELMMRMSPLTIRRTVSVIPDPSAGVGRVKIYVEDWSPNEMVFAVAYPNVL
jgi:DNA-directed RNA polymerase subunit K/omega